MPLTIKQQRFIEAFNGNAAAAARAAGYRHPDRIGSRLMTRPEIKSAILSREAAFCDETIATRAERQQFWSAVMRDDSVKLPDRLRASELLAKSEGDFLDRHELTGAEGAPLFMPPVTVRFVE